MALTADLRPVASNDTIVAVAEFLFDAYRVQFGIGPNPLLERFP